MEFLEMIELMLGYPYYDNKVCLERQLQVWTQFPRELARRVEFVLVDDGSPQPAMVAPDCPMNLTLVRIKEDIPWSQPGARNLGRKREDGSTKCPHPHSFLVHRKMFWRVGGHDEDFCGHHTGKTIYSCTCSSRAPAGSCGWRS